MRLPHLLLCALASVPYAGFAQTVLSLTPIADCSVGYHDNYNSANTNYESSSHYSGFAQPGYNGGVNNGRGLMAFDLSSIPPNSTILAAFLHLTAIGPFATTGEVATVGHIGDNACTLRRITQSWDESVVTWNTQPSTTTVDEVVLPQSTYATQNYLGINVGMLVQDMIDDPANSYGFELALVNETVTRGLAFHSSEAVDPDRWPLLTLVYGECEGPIGMVAHDVDQELYSVHPTLVTPGGSVMIDGNKRATRLDLIDAQGQHVMSQLVDQWPFTLHIPILARGIYCVTMSDGKGAMCGQQKLTVH